MYVLSKFLLLSKGIKCIFHQLFASKFFKSRARANWYIIITCNYNAGLSPGGGAGGGLQPPPIFDRSVNPISNRGGQFMPTTVLPASPDFQTLRRVCDVNIFWYVWPFEITRWVKSLEYNSQSLKNVFKRAKFYTAFGNTLILNYYCLVQQFFVALLHGVRTHDG